MNTATQESFEVSQREASRRAMVSGRVTLLILVVVIVLLLREAGGF
jgi:hypothetical protein